MAITSATFKYIRFYLIPMPAVKISDRHNSIIEEEQESMEDEHGFTPRKKELVEKAIEEKYESVK